MVAVRSVPVGSVLGVVVSILWWGAAASTVDAATAAPNALLHVAGALVYGAAVVIPPVRTNLHRRVTVGS